MTDVYAITESGTRHDISVNPNGAGEPNTQGSLGGDTLSTGTKFTESVNTSPRPAPLANRGLVGGGVTHDPAGASVPVDNASAGRVMPVKDV